jgi:hypothetical protein
VDSPLEGDGFELFVPRHESPEFRSIPGIAGSSTRNDACPAFHRNGVFVAARRPSRDTLRRAITRILSDGSVPISAPLRLTGIFMLNLPATGPYWKALIAVLSSQSANHTLTIGASTRDHGVPGVPGVHHQVRALRGL